GDVRILDDGEYREGDGLRGNRRLLADPAAGCLQRPDQEPGMTSTSARFVGKLRRDYSALAGFALSALVLLAVAPAVLTDFRLSLLGRFVCYGIVAVGIGLAWGRGGMLTLGQGVFFGLGGYVMAIHLKLADAGPSGVPDFMRLYGSGHVPSWWEPFRS